jgi:hypothetical protein
LASPTRRLSNETYFTAFDKLELPSASCLFVETSAVGFASEVAEFVSISVAAAQMEIEAVLPVKLAKRMRTDHPYQMPIMSRQTQRSHRSTCLVLSIRDHGAQHVKRVSLLVSRGVQPVAAGRSSTSKMTRIVRLQPGHTAISSPSRSESIQISKRSPQGHG